MTWRRAKLLDQPGPRHEPGWYDQSAEEAVLEPGDRIFVECEGGPCRSRLETFPPRLEIPERGGLYALVDSGPRSAWRYVFVPNDA